MPESIDDRPAHRRHLLGVGDVGLEHERLAAHALDVVRHRPGLVDALQVDDRHVGALGRHGPRVRGADPLRRTGHDAHLVLQPIPHVLPSPPRERAPAGLDRATIHLTFSGRPSSHVTAARDPGDPHANPTRASRRVVHRGHRIDRHPRRRPAARPRAGRRVGAQSREGGARRGRARRRRPHRRHRHRRHERDPRRRSRLRRLRRAGTGAGRRLRPRLRAAALRRGQRRDDQLVGAPLPTHLRAHLAGPARGGGGRRRGVAVRLGHRTGLRGRPAADPAHDDVEHDHGRSARRRSPCTTPTR